jgi:hypothetical protein
MAKKPAIHTVPHGGGWANRREGGARVSKVFPTKAAAQAAGRETARRERTEHIIHKKDGEIGSRNSYGSDPRPQGLSGGRHDAPTDVQVTGPVARRRVFRDEAPDNMGRERLSDVR